MLLPARKMVLAMGLLMKLGRMSSFSLYPLRHRSSGKPAAALTVFLQFIDYAQQLMHLCPKLTLQHSMHCWPY